jgi:hypothetical protein
MIATGGCLKVDRAGTEQVFVRTVAIINDMCGVLEQARDVQEAGPKVDALIKTLEQVRDEGNRIAVGPAAMKEIQGKFQDQFQKAGQRLYNARQALLQRDPGGAAELQAILSKFDKIMNTR